MAPRLIDNFVAHAANERTYLAWIRTAVSIVGFGLVIEKLDPVASTGADRLTGALLVGSGLLLIAFAAVRFVALQRRIASPRTETAFGIRFGLVFVLMNSMLVLLLAVFAWHAA